MSGERLRAHAAGAPLHYQVTQEASNARWLFALEVPRTLPVLPDRGVTLSAELEIQASTPLTRRVRYDLASFVHYRLHSAPLQRVCYRFRDLLCLRLIGLRRRKHHHKEGE